MNAKKKYSPIFITGIERSGSSIIAKIIKACGGFTGITTEMYENIQINKLFYDYYSSLNVDTKGQHPLPDTKQLIIPTDWKQKVENILIDERYDAKQPWVCKGSRLSQTWPIWFDAFPSAKWIIVRRRPSDIIQSCLKTGYMTAFTKEASWNSINVTDEASAWLWWIKEHEKRFVDMWVAGMNCKQVWPERMVTGDFQQMIEAIEWLGLTWDDAIIEMVDKLLWNSKQKERSINGTHK